MKTSTLNRSLGLVVSALVAVAAGACGDGDTSDGAGGSAAASTGQGATTGTPASSSEASTGSGVPGNQALIDDMEDDNNAILTQDGRQGAWFAYNDQSKAGMQTPAAGAQFTMTELPEPREGSKFAAHTTGSGFTEWGAGLGFDLKVEGTKKTAYDASKYTGITFWARVGAGSTTSVRLNIGDKNTSQEGEVCDPTACGDHFGQGLTLTESWQEFTFTFAELKAENWSMANLTALDPTALYAVYFQVGKEAGTFDIWVDDIAFTE